MTWLRKTRPLLLALGGVALVGSLLGARLLGPGGGGGTDSSGKSPPAPAGKDTIGTVVIGDADSDPPPARYNLPPVLQSGQVSEVFVKQGDPVKAGDKLYRFDTTILDAELEIARATVGGAKAKADTARGAADQHAKKVNLQKQVVAAYEAQVKLALEAWRLGEINMVESWKRQGLSPANIEEARKNDVKLYELHADHELKKVNTTIERAKLADLEAAKENQVDKLIAEADADVKRAEGVVKRAESAIRLCTVTARKDGTVERVSVSPGDVMGISSVAPALVLIPSGPRVVRARVEAEFAQKIDRSQIGRVVTIQDFTDPRVTYQGRVRGLGDSFLPRRANEGAIVQNETRSLEVVIEVLDAAPPGKPPLRVGQQVRVTFAP
jgi:multidrug resistance efflux pump